MKIDRCSIYNFDNAVHGARNPLNSWEKSDSMFGIQPIDNIPSDVLKHITFKWSNPFKDDNYYDKQKWLKTNGEFNKDLEHGFETFAYLGPNDLGLLQRLIKAGNSDAKFLRQIMVSVDITAPLYWWKEADQYRVGVTTNSTSTMHKLASTPITRDCFEFDDFNDLKVYDNEPYQINDYTQDIWDFVIDVCETLRQRYQETKDQKYWKELIRLLPESWLQTRTFTCNYAILRNIYFQRHNHRLSEWHFICDWIETLPYANELITYC